MQGDFGSLGHAFKFHRHNILINAKNGQHQSTWWHSWYAAESHPFIRLNEHNKADPVEDTITGVQGVADKLNII
jgi:hypothetical protein